jgi:hypothetical protein
LRRVFLIITLLSPLFDSQQYHFHHPHPLCPTVLPPTPAPCLVACRLVSHTMVAPQ